MLNTSYADVARQHGFIPADHKAAKFEHVEARKLFDEKGEELPGWQRIYNVTRQKTLHVATDQYRVVTNEEAFTAFEQSIRDSGLNTDNMMVGTDYSHMGARIFRQYLFPDHMVPVKPGVDVALRIIMFNSYDGTMAFKGLTGALNFVCANTCIMGNEIAGFSMRHNSTADVDKAAKSLVDAADYFAKEAQGWRDWPRMHVEDSEAVRLFKAIPGISQAGVEQLTLAWVTARDNDPMQGGPNVWTLYNVLTAWATHTEGKGANKAASRYKREGDVQRTLLTKEWKQLAHA
jgi:hypothetical protein